MSKYINLDDPEVRYYLNFGMAEVYIVPPEAERIDLVRCGECKFYQDNNGGYPHEECRWGKDETPNEDDYCSYGERREDG